LVPRQLEGVPEPTNPTLRPRMRSLPDFETHERRSEAPCRRALAARRAYRKPPGEVGQPAKSATHRSANHKPTNHRSANHPARSGGSRANRNGVRGRRAGRHRPYRKPPGEVGQLAKSANHRPAGSRPRPGSPPCLSFFSKLHASRTNRNGVRGRRAMDLGRPRARNLSSSKFHASPALDVPLIRRSLRPRSDRRKG
jgi:hypothetical protein